MTLTALEQRDLVSVDDDRITIEHLCITNAEAAALLGSIMDTGGGESAADVLRRAVPLGLVVLRLGSASMDSGAISRTLDGFADQIQARSQQTLERPGRKPQRHPVGDARPSLPWLPHAGDHLPQ